MTTTKIKKTRMKAAATGYVPQDRDACARDITTIGVLQREQAHDQLQLNEKLSQLAQEYQPRMEDRQKRLDELQRGVQTWCEANRHVLTLGGKSQSHNLITGIVGWRRRPASVTVTGAEEVIKLLKAANLVHAVRVKEEVNKDWILDNTEAVKDIKGIRITSGIEDFYIEPVELQASGTVPAEVVA